MKVEVTHKVESGHHVMHNNDGLYVVGTTYEMVEREAKRFYKKLVSEYYPDLEIEQIEIQVVL